MIENFIFNDIVLYCKGWYQTPKGDTMLDDLGYLFSKIYGWTPKTEQEIANFMLRVLDEVVVKLNVPANSYKFYTSHALFIDEVRRRMIIYEQSMDMSIIYLVRSVLQVLSRDEIKLNAPHYSKKEHFRLGMLIGEYPISQTYTEMNRRAQEAFNT